MKTRSRCAGGALAAACMVWFQAGAAPAEPPRLLPFQGHLTDQQGNPVPDGFKVIQFKIYDAPIGGAAVWPGEVHQVSVNGGLVNVILGTKAKFSQTIDSEGQSDVLLFNRLLYLEIVVDANGDDQITEADPPMLPRQAIVPVVFAVDAQYAEIAANSEKLNGADWGDILNSGNDPAASEARIKSSLLPAVEIINSLDSSDGSPRNALYVNAAGNVGIGTTSPDENLDVKGNIEGNEAFIGEGGHGKNHAHFSHVDMKGEDKYALLQKNDGTTFLNAAKDRNLLLRVDNRTKIIVKPNGKVGIGTTNPGTKLEVNGGIRSKGMGVIVDVAIGPVAPGPGWERGSGLLHDKSLWIKRATD